MRLTASVSRSTIFILSIMFMTGINAQISSSSPDEKAKEKEQMKKKYSEAELESQSQVITAEQAMEVRKKSKKGKLAKSKKPAQDRMEMSTDDYKKKVEPGSIRKATPEEIEAIRNGSAANETSTSKVRAGGSSQKGNSYISSQARDSLAADTEELNSQITEREAQARQARERIRLLAQSAEEALQSGTMSKSDYESRMQLIGKARQKISELDMAIRAAKLKLVE